MLFNESFEIRSNFENRSTFEIRSNFEIMPMSYLNHFCFFRLEKIRKGQTTEEFPLYSFTLTVTYAVQ